MKRTGRCYIVAEIGGNFTDYETGVKLIDLAEKSGVDAVKLQTYKGETVASRQAVFDMENTGIVSQLAYFKKYEIDEEMHRELFLYAREKGLDIFSTPAHITDVELLERIGVNIYKVGADDATNLPLLKYIAKLHKPIMLSTGMCTLQEVHEAVDAILGEGNSDIAIMHVVSLYPTAPQYVNLKAIKTLKKEFSQFMIGYSDHTQGVDSCIFAAVLGAEIIEKHFTYDKNADGPDHMLSADYEEMRYLVEKVRLFEQMSGTGIKMPMGDEIKNRSNNRKSIICVNSKSKGEIIKEADLDIKRPGFGIEPKYKNIIVGRRTANEIDRDSVLMWSDLE